MDVELNTTWVEIDLGAIRSNIQQMNQFTNTAVMAVVKANAYGHGLVEVAKAAQQAQSPWLGVARVEEGVLLREAGVTGRILVLGYTAPEQVRLAAAQGIDLTVYDPDVVKAYVSQLSDGDRLNVQAKVDVGMGRLGVFPQDALGFVEFLRGQPRINLAGIFTHFPTADEPARNLTLPQFARFERVLEQLEARQIRPPLAHAANSAAAINYPETRLDLVRTGIAIYGLHPSPETRLPQGFRPALSWKARLTSLKTLPKGSGVSYNYRYITPRDMRIGAVAVGYADGLRRRLDNYMLVGGRRVPVLGSVCMDQCMVSLEDLPGARIGEEVVLIGKQGDETITAEELGEAWGTLNYEVVCGLATRSPRIYINRE